MDFLKGYASSLKSHLIMINSAKVYLLLRYCEKKDGSSYQERLKSALPSIHYTAHQIEITVYIWFILVYWNTVPVT